MRAVASTRSEIVVDVHGISRTFGNKKALDNVHLRVPRGSVFGIVGENGAGKTTLLRHIMGNLKPQSGTVRVLGLDPIADLTQVLSRVGYLSSAQDLPGWMRIEQLLAYNKTFYPGWDDAYADKLTRTFDLDVRAKIKTLSTGQNARVGLVVALAYRPELLVLDEPSSGLDPVVRRDILEAIIGSISDAGSTVVFSSHLLDEVERVSDHIAMIQGGRILECDSLESIKSTYRVLTVSFEECQPLPPTTPPAITWHGGGREWTAICRSVSDDLAAEVTMIGGQVVESQVPTLDEIFFAHSAAHISNHRES